MLNTLNIRLAALNFHKRIKPLTRKGYAQVLADPALQLHFQDLLDTEFQERIVAVRNALRRDGWESDYPWLTRGADTIRFQAKRAGAGRKIVAVTWFRNGIEQFPDLLTQTPERIAQQLAADAALSTPRRISLPSWQAKDVPARLVW